MLDTEKDVQGVAVYYEFRKEVAAYDGTINAATTQMFITPDGYAEDGRFSSSTVYRRVVTSYSPRKQWRASSLGYPDDAMRETGTPSPLSTEEVEGAGERRLTYARSLFRSLLDGGWQMVKEPLFVEVSKKDLSDVAMAKTPAKVVYRINQTRSTKGFPENLY